MWTIRKPEILRRLTERLGIEPGVISPDLVLPGAISLVVDLDALLEEAVADTNGALVLTPAAGSFVEAFLVPVGEVWELLMITRSLTTANSNIGARIGGQYIPLSPPATTALTVWTGRGYFFHPGDQLGMLTTGNAGDGARVLDIWYNRRVID